MKKVVFTSLIFASYLFGTSIENIVQKSLQNNFDIKSLENSIEIANFQIKQAKNWENPMISFKANDIMLNKNYLNNQKEYGIELSQAIPIGKKLELEESIAKKDKLLKEQTLQDIKLEFESKIYLYSYTILILENRLKLLNEYQKNLNRLEELYTKLYSYDKVSLNEILNTQISKYDLQMKINELQTTKDNLYLSLEQISYEKIDKIDDNLVLKDINRQQIEEQLIFHPKIQTLQTTSQKYKDTAQLEDAKKFSSITLALEYMQNKEQDYANITMSMPLPIYNTENINKLKANLNTNETNNKLDSQIHNLRLQTKIYLNNLEQYKTNYKILQEKIVPIKQKIQKVLEEFVGFDKESLKENLNSLNELIDYEMKASEQLEKYFENYSELIYYSNKGVK
ncbi:TolC family protein [Aliarcobacter cryaerophilus]|uniref:TolC family protein n=4 Tax=Arcobacteraceae TaxID=2808963 RepID=A0AA96IJW2_9BACT|nr:TolC family protein [Aliarcobacter cryaerophilus]WNL29888.1 TolC family protein [Arcobacter sp. AZ-2023]WPD10959.1 TolC family protein [Arcobacter sp. DSM 115960]MCT7486853.1 TolC family protein [Aliarcobacter cryaerophilus]MCT7491137.1 TolC family protein [Aliarcobacter cryaerophilus]WNL33199.1 TolC family protein [Arcobacter sp. AZ-2023]